MELKCWFQRKCGNKEICKDCTDLESCTRYIQMYLQTVNAGIPRMMPLNHQLEKPKSITSPDWEVYQNLYSIDLEAFVESGKSMTIESDICGNGKTTWAQRLLLKYLTKQLGKSNSGYYVSQAFYEIKKSIDTGEDLPYENAFLNARLLVLDDVAHKRYTEFEVNWLMRLSSLRQSKGLATIYTMNTKQNIKEFLGDRLYSMIYTASEHYVLRECDKRGWDKKEW